jgi:hypothetical protein
MKPKGGPETIGSIVNAVLLERGFLAPVREWGVVNDWAKIVGNKLASVTECDRVENGVLFVRVVSAPWRQELSYVKHKILESIRQQTPCTTITDIVFF